MDFLKKKRAAFETVDLTKRPPTPDELRAICRSLGVAPRDILRPRDPAFEKLGLGSGRHSDAQLLELMSRNPGLIQRPIVVKGSRAVVARPPEAAAALLD